MLIPLTMQLHRIRIGNSISFGTARLTCQLIPHDRSICWKYQLSESNAEKQKAQFDNRAFLRETWRKREESLRFTDYRSVATPAAARQFDALL